MLEYTEVVTMIVTRLPAVLRLSPNESSDVLLELRLGTEVEVAAVQDGWVQLNCGGWLVYAAIAQPIEEGICFEVVRY